MTRRMKAYALAMYPLCWAADWLYMLLPTHRSEALYRIGLWLLPWAGMYAFSETFEDFCQCKPFRREA